MLVDVEERFLEKARAAIEKNLDREVAKGKRTAEDKAAALGRIATTTRLEAWPASDAVIEAIVEDEAVKKELFRKLDADLHARRRSSRRTRPRSRSRAWPRRRGGPERFIGMHFMNPVPVMELVEVIRGIATSDATAAAVDALARRMGKTPILCNDYPGFVSNRVLMPMINEAIEALREGVATREAIDGIMKLGMNHPMGPLTLADFIGLDTCLVDPPRAPAGLRRPEVPPEPAARPHGRRRLARQEVRPRLLRVPGAA